MKIKANNLRDKIYEDNREIQKLYYNPKEKNPHKIEESIIKIGKKLEEK